MIIDDRADFRSLLMHHITTHWPDAVLTAYDPEQAGRLPQSFSGAGNDLVLLGHQLAGASVSNCVRQFAAVKHFPPILYVGPAVWLAPRVMRTDSDARIDSDRPNHRQLIATISKLLRKRRTPAASADEPAPVRGYRLKQRLSSSEHSTVYLTEKESTGQEVVLKVLSHVPDVHDGDGAFDRFIQEYELIAGIRHPNVVKIFDLGVSDEQIHIAMEYLPRGNLKAQIRLGIAPVQAIDYLRQIAGALAEIHPLGVLHRDLKPGNIMLRDDGSLALIDFGLAKQMRLRMDITDTGEIFGTPYYMSPEQGHANEVDSRSDIYSVGIIFYEMLTGQKPFVGSNAMAVIYKHSHQEIPRLPESQQEYQQLVDLLLAKNPAKRLQSATAILEYLH